MRWLKRRRDLLEQELDDEMRFHIERQIADYVREGMSPEAARHRALREFGGAELAKEECRDQRWWRFAEQFCQDLHYATRVLRKSPGFTAAAIISLALGIGANTALFSIIDTLMFTPLPVSHPEQLVNFRDHASPRRIVDVYPYSAFERFRQQAEVFSDVSAIALLDRTNVAIGGTLDAGPARVALVSGNYFRMLGVTASQGRTLTPEDDRAPGGHPVALISDGFWERRLARARNVLERKLILNGIQYSILGVTPPGFLGDWAGRPADIWIPMAMQSQVMIERPGLVGSPGDQAYWLRVVARLKSGVSREQAQAVGRVEQQRLFRDWWGGPNATAQTLRTIAARRLDLEPAARGYYPQRESMTQSLALLLLVAGLALSIACANMAGMLLARSEARRREMAVRLAIGAGRARLVRQLLTESVLLSGLAGTLGLAFAAAGTNVLAATISARPVPMNALESSSWISFDLHVNLPALVFTAAICLLTGVLFGLAPAFRGTNVSLTSGRSGRGVVAGGSRFAAGKLFVIVQVALSLPVLIGAGLFVRTLDNLQRHGLGFERRHLLLVWTQPAATGQQGLVLAQLWHAVQQRISSLPGVISAGASNGGLLTGYDHTVNTGPPLRVEGQLPKPGLPGGRAFVTPRFFEAAGVELLAGRDFTEFDTSSTRRVVIINKSMASYYFGDRNPVGRMIEFPGDPGVATQIIGVVRDFTIGTPRVGQKLELSFFPYRDRAATGLRIAQMCVVVRTSGDPLTLASRVRQELRDIDPNLPVLKIDTVEQQLSVVLSEDRLIAGLASFFGFLIILLACLGLYGLISFTVARRTNEIGVRLALGAAPSGVFAMVVREGLRLVAVGIAIGLVAALAGTRVVSSRLFGISPIDPSTITAATLLMMAVAAFAGFAPAWRASKVDPMVALRYE
jgi:predicted permease